MTPELRKKIAETLAYYASHDDEPYAGAGFDILRWARKGYIGVEAAAEIERLTALLDFEREEAVNKFAAIGEMCWDKRGMDALRHACDEASMLATEAEGELRARIKEPRNA